jgi:tetratricopeptide (TPR) repeat protein
VSIGRLVPKKYGDPLRYARGWLNLGISHANLGQHGAAVRAYLRALELNPAATHIWNYLRMALGRSVCSRGLLLVKGT